MNKGTGRCNTSSCIFFYSGVVNAISSSVPKTAAASSSHAYDIQQRKTSKRSIEKVPRLPCLDRSLEDHK